MNKIISIVILSLAVQLQSQNLIQGNNPTFLGTGMGIYYDSIVALGFSKDNHFAYLYYHNGDALSFWQLRVQNLLTNEIVFRSSWEEFYMEEDPTDLLQGEEEFLNEIYSEYEIEITSMNRLHSFPIEYNGENYWIDLITEDLPTDEDLLSMGLKSQRVDIFFNREDGGYQLDGYTQNMESRVFGYIKNPLTEGLAVIIQKKEMGFEGSQLNTLHIYGVSLVY